MHKALLFDLNGTLINIWTDETREDLFRTVAYLMSFYGVEISASIFRDRFYEINREQRKASKEEYPEFDVKEVFKALIKEYAGPAYKALTPAQKDQLPEFLSKAFRAASMLRLELYPKVKEVLTELKKTYRIAALSDAQSLWAIPELRCTGLEGLLEFCLISSDFGYRKPDKRFFQAALKKLDLKPEEVIFVGNDMLRDVYGASQMGMKSIFFKSNQGDHDYHNADPDYIIYEFSQLPEAVKFIENSAVKAGAGKKKGKNP